MLRERQPAIDPSSRASGLYCEPAIQSFVGVSKIRYTFLEMFGGNYCFLAPSGSVSTIKLA
jgi:hypothetical protein